MQDEVKDAGTWGRKLWQEAAADNDGLRWSCPTGEQEWRVQTKGKSLSEAPGLDAGSANTLEMLIVAAVVNWYRQLRTT